MDGRTHALRCGLTVNGGLLNDTVSALSKQCPSRDSDVPQSRFCAGTT